MLNKEEMTSNRSLLFAHHHPIMLINEAEMTNAYQISQSLFCFFLIRVWSTLLEMMISLRYDVTVTVIA